ncbi:hypothetical protein [Prevotella sp.]|uniref:hypothetical protein n=1 Tax=Prevotella sp. TaxID=59823 RepID=UPI00307F161C
MWKDIAQCHRRGTRSQRLPNTNQMDLHAFRTQKENILKAYRAFWAMHLGVTLPNDDVGCYATQEIANEYRHPREDNLFVKNVSLPISTFEVKYPPLTESNCAVMIKGRLFLSVNIDNNVATAIVVLNFENLSVYDVILLKHTFYKRCHISIYEDRILQNVDTFQEYVTLKLRAIYPYLKDDIDSRARYMLLEVEEPIANLQDEAQRDSIIYAMLTSDEGWEHAENIRCSLGRNRSTRDSYKLYYNSKNAIIVSSCMEYSQYLQEKACFWERIIHAPNHIEKPTFTEYRNIAGIDKHLYAKYLKTVEIDYLITNALTNEISDKISKSLLNPIKLGYRAYKLWKILNELDLNLYHIDNTMLCSFGVTKRINEIRQEYNEIVGVLTNYLLLLVAVLTLFATIVTILK